MNSSFDSIASRRPRSYGPWTGEHLSRLLAGNAVSLVVLGSSWWQVSGTGSVRVQVGWMIAGIAAVGIAGAANASWLLRGLQSVSAGRDLVVPRLGAQPRLTGRGRYADQAGHIEQVIVPGTTRFHRPDCVLTRGRAVVARGDAVLAVCEVCRPDR